MDVKNNSKALSKSEIDEISRGKQLYKDKKYREAMEIFLKYAEVDADCSFNLGVMYDFKYGVQKDDSVACYWYEISAELGGTVAQYNLANYCRNGIGTEKNEKKAFELYSKASKQGYADAIYQLARCYDKGIGTDKDAQKAIECYKLGSERGNLNAKYMLASKYETGQSVTKDLDKALTLYEEAATKGHSDSKKKVPEVKKIIEEEKQQAESKKTASNPQEVNTSSVAQSEVVDKEHSMLNTFVKYLDKNGVPYSVVLESNIVRGIFQTKNIPNAAIMLKFSEEIDYFIQYVTISFYNYISFSSEKIYNMYKLCNVINKQYRNSGFTFYVDESDNTININIRYGYIKNVCGEMCLSVIAELIKIADEAHSVFMKEIWS